MSCDQKSNIIKSKSNTTYIGPDWDQSNLRHKLSSAPKLSVLFSVCGSGCVSRLGPVPLNPWTRCSRVGFGNPSTKKSGIDFLKCPSYTILHSYAGYAPWKWWINASTKAAVAATPATANCERPSRLSASTCRWLKIGLEHCSAAWYREFHHVAHCCACEKVDVLQVW